VLTPHAGEFARLGGELTGDAPADALRFARACNSIVVLKGHRSVAAFPDGKVYITTHGNPGMAKGGSGDVLTGIITGLLSQGVEPYHGACLGSYLLGTSADKAFDLLRERMLRATNVIEALEDMDQ
jgi:NAD(P)H-hydrate epimerase